jgi:DNA polymerase elongation subunit (family B)
MIVLDIEVYKDYFLLAMKQMGGTRVEFFELYEGHVPRYQDILKIMLNHTTVSFNGISYDLPLIKAMTEGMDNETLKSISDEIITSDLPSWTVCKTNNIIVPKEWDHIDIIAVAPGIASLKVYGGRIRAPKMQDLPIEPSASIAPSQHELMRQYCVNDLETTELLYDTLTPQIELRESMSDQYAIDLRSKSDPQIAEAVIKKELTAKTGRQYYKPVFDENLTIRYDNPGIVKFNSPALNEIFQAVLAHEFKVKTNGQLVVPAVLNKAKVLIDGRQYKMGVGGLHSMEKNQFVWSQSILGGVLCEWDVASYYPSIIMQQELSPDNLGEEFLKVYQDMLTRRLEAKGSGDKVTAGTLKICLNGSFGKLGSRYSALYAPQLLLQTTLTGQFCLLMLIERMVDAGVRVVSANTDGIVCATSKREAHVMAMVAENWMRYTTFDLERTDYELIAARDVNSYFAVKADGKVKRKGIFNVDNLMKNPNRNIVYTAVIDYINEGVGIADTIEGCKDIHQFVTVRKVTGGALWGGIDLGKSIRYYSSVSAADVDPYIRYKLNGNKVPKSDGCRPLMEMGGLPSDVDYWAYVRDAEKLLGEVGYYA